MLKNRTRLAIASSVIAITTVVAAGPASAAVHATNTRVDGYANWSWGDKFLSNVDFWVTDKACNGVPVYVRLYVYPKGQSTPVKGARHYNYAGCGTTATYFDLSWNSSYQIAGVRVHACEEPGVNCVSSEYHDNPLN